MIKRLVSLITVCVIAGCSQLATSVNTPPPVPPVPQGVAGFVFDAETSAPIQGASVQLDSRNKPTATTDSAGHFVLEDIAVGNYGIRAWATDHAPDTMYVSVDTALLAPAMFQLGTTSLTKGLVAQYMFDHNSLADGSSFHGTATLTDGVFVADRFNNIASALEFNGSSTTVTIPDAPNLNFGKNDFSICFWVKGLTSTGSIISKSIGTGSDPFFGYRIAGGSYSFTTRIGTTYGEATSDNSYLSTQDGRWHFFVYVFDRTGSISLYLDASPVYASMSGSTSSMAGSCDVAAPLMIGADSTGNSVKGILDDVRLYKGMLNPTQINLLYHENGW